DEVGVISEAEVLAGDLEYADMVRLPKDEEDIILRAMHLMVVDRGLCIRQHLPDRRALLIFPSLYKPERPERPSHPLILMTFRFEGWTESELLDRFGTDPDWFNASRSGCGNQGHDFWSRIRTDSNRRALIEYLKTL